MTREAKNRAGLAALAAVALRLALWAHLSTDPRQFLRADSLSYKIPAVNLLAGRGFSGSTQAPYAPETSRTPGYPLFLAAHRLVSYEDRWPALTQVFLDAGTAVLAASCASLLAPGPWVWLAAAFYGLEPMTVAHAPLLLTEPLFGFLLTLALYWLLRAGPEGRVLLAGSAGLILGAATLVRPISLYLWLPLCAALAWPWRRRPAALAALALGAALIPATWCARNQTLFGSVSFSSLPGVNFLYYDAAAVEAAATGIPGGVAARELRERFESENPGLTDPFEASRRQAAAARRVFAAHPLALLRVHAFTGLKMLLGPGVELVAQELYGETSEALEDRAGALSGRGTRAILARRPALWAVVAFQAMLLAAVYLLSLRGLLVVARRGAFFAAAWLVPLFYLAIISTGGWCYYRFRVPLWPLFCVLAAAGTRPLTRS